MMTNEKHRQIGAQYSLRHSLKRGGLLFAGACLTLLFLVPHNASAAISYVDSSSCTATANNGADATLTFPSMQPGDLVIVGHQIPDDDSDHDLTLSDMTDWTEVADLFANDTGDDAQLAVYWKVMGATPDTSATAVGAGAGSHADTDTSAVCMVFRGVDTETPMDVTPTFTTGLDTMHPDPPSINHNNPLGVWTVIVGSNADTLGATGSYTFPTGYTENTVEDRASDNTDGTIGISFNSGPSDPENPEVMTHSGTDSTVRSWAAVTMALRPSIAVAPAVTTGFASNISPSAATLAGAITSDGGASITQHGFATSTSPTLSTDVSTTTLDSGSTGEYNGAVLLNAADTTYYYRAYGTNSGGTGYGEIRSFNSGNTTVTRIMRLFEGFIIKFISGKLIFHQR